MAARSRWSAMAGRLFEFNSYRTISVHDYSNVLVPLEEAHDYSHAARTGRRSEYEAPPGEEESNGLVDGNNGDDEDVESGSRTDLDNGERRKNTGGASRADDDEDEDDNEASAASGMLPMRACEYSIEGLRREVRKRPEGSKEGRQRWTDYECMFPLLDSQEHLWPSSFFPHLLTRLQ